MARDSIHGTGFRFPPIPDGTFRTVTGADAVAQALRCLLMTEPGERIARPSYGVGLRRFLFAPNTVATRTLVQQAVAESVERFEPRAVLESVRVTTSSRAPTRLDIDLRYTLIEDPTPRNLVYPFYLDGGTD